MLVFAIGASTFGLAEESIPLKAIVVGLCVGLRMDALTAVAIMHVGRTIGYAAATINPFTIVIAQDISGLPLLSGLTFRLVMFVPIFMIGFFHVWRYAKQVRDNPSGSLAADVAGGQPAGAEHLELQGRHKIVLAMSLAALGVLVWEFVERGWYLTELGALFFALAVLTGLVMGQSVNEMAKVFSLGAAELTGTALVIGFARCIEIMLVDGRLAHHRERSRDAAHVSGRGTVSHRHVVHSVRCEFLHSIGLGTGLCHHAAHGAHLGHCRSVKADRHSRVSDGRRVKTC